MSERLPSALTGSNLTSDLHSVGNALTSNRCSDRLSGTAFPNFRLGLSYPLCLSEVVHSSRAVAAVWKIWLRRGKVGGARVGRVGVVLDQYYVSSVIKSVSKVRGQLCDSRKSYIASVTIHPEGRQFHATDIICKKVPEIVYWCGHWRPLVVISGHNSNPHSSNMTSLNNIFVVLPT